MWWLFGLVGLAVAVAIGVIVVKIINKRTIKEKLNKKMPSILKSAFKAKIKKKKEKEITVDVLDSWDSTVVPNIEIRGEEVADDIHVGDEIILQQGD